MNKEWLVIIAIALSLTFIFSSLANVKAHKLYAKYEDILYKYERPLRLPDDLPIDVGDAQVLIFGMGRVGTGVYDTMQETYGNKLLGIDIDLRAVNKHIDEGRQVIVGDATDYDFWERLQPGSVKLIMLDMPNINELLAAMYIIRQSAYQGLISVAVKHDDCIEPLLKAGADSVYNVYAEAGSGFANHVCENIKPF